MGLIAMILAASAATAGPPPHPLQLDVSRADDQVTIRLVGESATPVAAAYELEVTGKSNRSAQRGTAMIRPGRPVTIATLRLGGAKGDLLTAYLHVVPSTGEPYDLQWQSEP
jgi:hypothetical protein